MLGRSSHYILVSCFSKKMKIFLFQVCEDVWSIFLSRKLSIQRIPIDIERKFNHVVVPILYVWWWVWKYEFRALVILNGQSCIVTVVHIFLCWVTLTIGVVGPKLMYWLLTFWSSFKIMLCVHSLTFVGLQLNNSTCSKLPQLTWWDCTLRSTRSDCTVQVCARTPVRCWTIVVGPNLHMLPILPSQRPRVQCPLSRSNL